MAIGRTAAALLLTTLALVALAGCGDDGKKDSSAPAAGSATPAAPARAADERIIRKWSEQLRAGKLEDASRLFAVPATVQNGTGPELLGTRALVLSFNASLPCGAKLLATARKGPYTVATFRLTERPGGDCGTGGGNKAATAFRIEGGKIVEWLRVPVPTPAPQPEQPEPPPAPSERPAPSETV